MKQSDLKVPVIEPIEKRYERDLLKLKDDRKVRGFDYQSEERRSRLYVDPEAVEVTKVTGEAADFTGQVATDISVEGTVTERFDNTPTGFDRAALEEEIVYNPNDAEDEVTEPVEDPEDPEEPETP